MLEPRLTQQLVHTAEKYGQRFHDLAKVFRMSENIESR
jgi:hypothetical protein